MQFNVSQLLREPVGATRRYDIDETVEIDGEPRRVSGGVEFVRTDKGVLVRADLVSVVKGECSRCLTPAEGPARIAFEEEYLQTVDVVTAAPTRERREPDALTIDARHMLDLADTIRQYWVLSAPMQPLCRPDCAGLCTVCGRNRNEEPCGCRPEDPRWAALEGLRGLQEK